MWHDHEQQVRKLRHASYNYTHRTGYSVQVHEHVQRSYNKVKAVQRTTPYRMDYGTRPLCTSAT